ncbi:MAG: DUF2520 domain-containing protein [Bacteroidaceae bacterium]|nr:DUF2520 domain-containing protein [Bacteroidaceae bacterium]
MQPAIGIVGTGNVATRMAVAMVGAGLDVAAVCSRSLEKAEALAARVDHEKAHHGANGGTCRATDRIGDLIGCDAVFLCVSDDAVAQTASRFAQAHQASLQEAAGGDARGPVLVHTAGSVPMDALRGAAKRYGVVYPLQTLSRDREVDFTRVPLFVEGSDTETTQWLTTLALVLARDVQILDSERRRQLHLAAVFACNFPNHLFGIAEACLRKAGVDRRALQPLIEETVAKFVENGAVRSQTGPAARGDRRVMARHEEMLIDFPQRLQIYKTLSQSIASQRDENANL